MRKTREQLLSDMPCWNENRHDIVKVSYGDIPLIHYDQEEYKRYSELTGTLANISAVEAYMYVCNGTYDTYDTLIGKIHIREDGVVMAGHVTVKYRGHKYDVILNRMYGLNALDIHRINQSVTGFSNKDGIGSPARIQNTKELEEETINKIINASMEDFGIGIQRFMEAVRETYKADPKNCIMEKCFNL